MVPRSSCLCRCNASRDAAGPAIIPAACRGGTAVPIPHLYRHPAKLPAPQGSHYSITAGERSEPAEGGLPPPSAPRGSNALCGCPAPASLGWQLSTGLLPWLAVQSVCPFDPLGAVHIYVVLLPRVRCAHPRLQSSSAPLGPWQPLRWCGCGMRSVCVWRMPYARSTPWGRTYICVALRPRVRCAHPRLQSSVAPLGPPSPSPFRCKIAGATPSRSMPLWYRCPRAYVGAAHPAKLPAPQGSHYSIAAGERSEPAEGAYLHYHRPQGGRTPYVRVLRRHPLGWQLSTGLLPWLAVQSVCPFDPLGAVHIYVWLSVRGFAALTRGYRIVRPPWGRLPRRHSAAKSRERRRPRRHPRSMSWWYRRPHTTSVQASREAAGPAGVALFYSRG